MLGRSRRIHQATAYQFLQTAKILSHRRSLPLAGNRGSVPIPRIDPGFRGCEEIGRGARASAASASLRASRRGPLRDHWPAATALLTPGCDVAEPYLEVMRLAQIAGCSEGRRRRLAILPLIAHLRDGAGPRRSEVYEGLERVRCAGQERREFRVKSFAVPDLEGLECFKDG